MRVSKLVVLVLMGCFSCVELGIVCGWTPLVGLCLGPFTYRLFERSLAGLVEFIVGVV